MLGCGVGAALYALLRITPSGPYRERLLREAEEFEGFGPVLMRLAGDLTLLAIFVGAGSLLFGLVCRKGRDKEGDRDA